MESRFPHYRCGSRWLTCLTTVALLQGVAQGTAQRDVFIQQQYLIDYLGRPYNLPTDTFTQAVKSSALATANSSSYPIPGYNVFAPAGNNNYTGPSADDALATDGFQLVVQVAADVSLQGANPADPSSFWAAGVDTAAKVFDAALISLSAPASVGSGNRLNASTSNVAGLDSGNGDSGWTVCAAVWLLGLSDAALANTTSSSAPPVLDGSCRGLLPPDCVADMAAGFDAADGNCQNQTVPRSCRGFLAGGLDGGAAFNVPQTLPSSLFTAGNGINTSNPFFIASTPPLDRGNETALDAVRNWVFPVVLSWTHSDQQGIDNGTAPATHSHVACVSASKLLSSSSSSAATGAENGGGAVAGLGDITSTGSLSRPAQNGWAILSAIVIVVLLGQIFAH
ncbi:hypothetical protein B0T24DRAFT_705137 [Lasiosphaeria ovina]|uniref:Uncharacterized protein n=1 Tax=Lasiosphaeria ovina TaxID=92902 RepID=A0AAE0K6X9_9PEZI|nr:hypothetical protein B0T24DRAFT_705137 [Lasiosphaeria ovina]